MQNCVGGPKRKKKHRRRRKGGGGKGGKDAKRVFGNILSLFHRRVGLSGLRLES